VLKQDSSATPRCITRSVGIGGEKRLNLRCMAGGLLTLALALAALPASAQLPASEVLTGSDRAGLQAEIARLERLLDSSPDKPAVTYRIARTWAAAKQWPEAIEWLRKAVAFRAGFDPSRDSIFEGVRATREFEAMEAAVREATPPVSHSRFAFALSEGDLRPESMAYDGAAKQFYFGSMLKGKVIRCSSRGMCEPFADGLGTVLGLKVYRGGLWVLSNSTAESALIHFDLSSGRVLRKYSVSGGGHLFNDLALAESGEVYFTETRSATVYCLANDASEPAPLPGRFEAANGIALSPDASLLYVSTFPDGISVVDLKSGTLSPIARPANLTLANIDGLYFRDGSLIAIQNGFMSPRVVRFRLDGSLRAIVSFDVLERRNPLFDGVTTGVISGGEFYYMANIQDEKRSGFEPIRILRLRL
jgi:sugar lactone lactonase YvrE